MRVDVYDRQDNYLITIGGKDLHSFVWTDELNGEDSVAISTTYQLGEGMRLVWKDRTGELHEHVCQDPQAVHSDGMVYYSDTALNSICELFGDFIEDKRPYGYTFGRALEVCLEPTRWEVGTVDQQGTVSDGLSFYATDCRTALNSILESGGELETEVERVGGKLVRRCGIRQHRGRIDGHRRFSYGKDLVSITRTEHWGAITACYGYGKGVETEAGGYGRKLTFGDINGGKDYVEDAEALATYGRPDGKGGLAHVFGAFEDGECEDAQTLMDETRAYLNAHKVPGVTYEASVVDLLAMGREWEAVGVGDDVQIVDKSFTPALRCSGRVTKMVTDMLGRTIYVTLGNVSQTIGDLIANQGQQLAQLQGRAPGWDAAASTPPSYLQQILDGLNEQFNEEGMSYRHTSFLHGDIWASVPLDENGNATEPGGTAIQLCAQGFRIADGSNEDGSWNWQVFGTGSGFSANCITAGTIVGGASKWNLETGELLFKQGMISSSDDKNVWNLSTGDMKLSGNVTISGGTIGDGRGNSWNLTTGDMTLAGNLTVSGGKIMDASGRNVWDLVNSTQTMASPDTTITGGVIQGKGGNYWNLNTGEMSLDFSQIESDLDSAVSSLSGKITTAQSTANAANNAAATAQSAASSAKNAASAAQSTANTANSKATSAKAKTDRITFTSAGMTVQGNNGQRYTAMTYGSDGIVAAGSMTGIHTNDAVMGIKDWGFIFQNNANTVRFWVSNERDEIYGQTNSCSFLVNSSGMTVNGRKVALE